MPDACRGDDEEADVTGRLLIRVQQQLTASGSQPAAGPDGAEALNALEEVLRQVQPLWVTHVLARASQSPPALSVPLSTNQLLCVRYRLAKKLCLNAFISKRLRE